MTDDVVNRPLDHIDLAVLRTWLARCLAAAAVGGRWSGRPGAAAGIGAAIGIWAAKRVRRRRVAGARDCGFGLASGEIAQLRGNIVDTQTQRLNFAVRLAGSVAGIPDEILRLAAGKIAPMGLIPPPAAARRRALLRARLIAGQPPGRAQARRLGLQVSLGSFPTIP